MNINPRVSALLSELSVVNEAILCIRESDRVKVAMRMQTGGVIYELSVPHKDFSFEGDTFAISQVKMFTNIVGSSGKNEHRHEPPLLTVDTPMGGRFTIREVIPTAIRGVHTQPLNATYTHRAIIDREVHAAIRRFASMVGVDRYTVNIDNEGNASIISTNTATSNHYETYLAKSVDENGNVVNGPLTPDGSATPCELSFTTHLMSLPWIPDDVEGYRYAYEMLVDVDGVITFRLIQIPTELPSEKTRGEKADVELVLHILAVDE